MENPTGTLTDTLMDQVGLPTDAPILWGHPRLSTTPPSVAIEALTTRIEALESAVHAVMAELEHFRAHSQASPESTHAGPSASGS